MAGSFRRSLQGSVHRLRAGSSELENPGQRKHSWPPGCSWSTMEAQLRPVPAPNSEEAGVADQPRSFEDFYEETYRRLYTALCLVTGNRHESEDIMQETFLRVFERWER